MALLVELFLFRAKSQGNFKDDFIAGAMAYAFNICILAGITFMVTFIIKYT